MEEEVKLLKAMADETRIKILLYLMNGEQCACTIVPFIGKAQPTVSQHLKILTEAGILNMRKDGIKVLYKIKNDKAIRILRTLDLQRMDIGKKK
jgi:DNA-binding transcriptional ArsR family regulator